MSAIWVEILHTRGSVPRDAGTAMKVTAHGLDGTIGGGALEYRAIILARQMLASGMSDDVRRVFALGPSLGQCCGGSVTLLFTRERRPTDTPRCIVHHLEKGRAHPGHLWLWGAGHVGRAVVQCTPSNRVRIIWVDDHPARFPENVPEMVRTVVATDLPYLAARAARDARHLIFTYSHEIDFALCAALLQREVAGIGLIGSDTKRTRFFRRLRAIGLDPGTITCPIGDKSRGKAPMDIAAGTIEALLREPGQAGAR